MLAVQIALAIMALATIALIFLGRSRGRITTGRFGRLARIGRLSARLSTSWLGSRVRRLFAGTQRRARIDEASRRAAAEAVATTMGEMKGAFMKLGQMMSFVSDDVPPEYRAALQALQAKAPPMDFALIRDVAERSLGKPLERAFSRFDEEPVTVSEPGAVPSSLTVKGIAPVAALACVN